MTIGRPYSRKNFKYTRIAPDKNTFFHTLVCDWCSDRIWRSAHRSEYGWLDDLPIPSRGEFVPLRKIIIFCIIETFRIGDLPLKRHFCSKLSLLVLFWHGFSLSSFSFFREVHFCSIPFTALYCRVAFVLLEEVGYKIWSRFIFCRWSMVFKASM